ncbi:MAG: HD domain-containing protein [Candidatus Eisenbacteria bacterium]|nr:HD domain-containing protein [Candidatus Eisenbacteria bacterium]
MNAWHDSPAEKARLRAEAVLRAQAWPPAVASALARFREAGGRAWLVGGSVRDVLLGRTGGGETDLATDLLPERVRALFPRTEPIGERHGTVLILHEGARIECTTLRREGEYADARHPDQVWFTRDPLEDLDRRDLTVNALAFDPLEGRLLDPHDGARDLERRILRAVGDPLTRFREDALRPLRVARLAAVLGMEIEARTRAALGAVRERAGTLAAERVRAELEKLVLAPKPSVGLEILREADLLSLWLPELQACRGVPQNRFHAYDVYFHSIYSCDAAPVVRPVVRWAALLHDIGKPATRVERRGEGTFYHHEAVGAELARTLLERLRFSTRFTGRVVHLVREHMFDYRSDWSDAALRRWLRRVGPEFVAELFDLRIADHLGNGLKSGNPAYLPEMSARVDRLLAAGAALTVADLTVDGDDVMRALGIGPGPEVGRTLAALLEEVTDDAAGNTRERLLARLAQRRASAPREAPSA